eukprot:1451573-Pyramimonas_sp.AAC.1
MKLAVVAECRSVVEQRLRKDHRWNYEVWSNLLGCTVWSHQVLKWHDVIVEDRWDEMVQDPQLVSKHGAEWFMKRKQVPPEWTDMLNKERGILTPAPRKGKQKYEELPGDHGEAARRVLANIKAAVDEQRLDSEDADMNDVQATLQGLIDEENAALLAKGCSPLPHKNSVGWACGLMEQMGWRKRKVGNTEDKDIDPDDEESFKQYFSRVVEKHGIKPPLWIAHDEFK